MRCFAFNGGFVDAGVIVIVASCFSRAVVDVLRPEEASRGGSLGESRAGSRLVKGGDIEMSSVGLGRRSMMRLVVECFEFTG
jgi:hypothetical protein